MKSGIFLLTTGIVVFAAVVAFNWYCCSSIYQNYDTIMDASAIVAVELTAFGILKIVRKLIKKKKECGPTCCCQFSQ